MKEAWTKKNLTKQIEWERRKIKEKRKKEKNGGSIMVGKEMKELKKKKCKRKEKTKKWWKGKIRSGRCWEKEEWNQNYFYKIYFETALVFLTFKTLGLQVFHKCCPLVGWCILSFSFNLISFTVFIVTF